MLCSALSLWIPTVEARTRRAMAHRGRGRCESDWRSCGPAADSRQRTGLCVTSSDVTSLAHKACRAPPPRSDARWSPSCDPTPCTGRRGRRLDSIGVRRDPLPCVVIPISTSRALTPCTARRYAEAEVGAGVCRRGRTRCADRATEDGAHGAASYSAALIARLLRHVVSRAHEARKQACRRA